jgi:hypothetical protein
MLLLLSFFGLLQYVNSQFVVDVSPIAELSSVLELCGLSSSSRSTAVSLQRQHKLGFVRIFSPTFPFICLSIGLDGAADQANVS